ncbi:MAG: hypothetical protein ABIZ49_10970 [Opitutaceae bacterium]
MTPSLALRLPPAPALPRTTDATVVIAATTRLLRAAAIGGALSHTSACQRSVKPSQRIFSREVLNE